MAALRLLCDSRKQALVDRRPRGGRSGGIRGRGPADGVRGRRARGRQGPARPARRRRLARMDLLSPPRRTGRGGPDDDGVRDERGRPRVGVARDGAGGAAERVGRPRRPRHRRSGRRTRGLRRASDEGGELVRADGPRARRRRARRARGDRRRRGRGRSVPRRAPAPGRRLPHLLRGAASRREPRAPDGARAAESGWLGETQTGPPGRAPSAAG